MVANDSHLVFARENPIRDQSGHHEDGRVISFLKRRLSLLIIASYLVGIIWTIAHPVVSVVTGELKCRGWFIDENSLDASQFRYVSKYEYATPDTSGITSLCLAIQNTLSDLEASLGNVECLNHQDVFEVLKVVPISNAVTPVSETIALVIPSSSDWLSSPYHNAILQLMRRLADSQNAPWLAKTVLLVAPVSINHTLTESIPIFLDSYLGTRPVQNSTSVPLMPPSFTVGILRNLLVVDMAIDETSTGSSEVLILPQGRRGLLPNMDLVFLVVSLVSRVVDNRRFGQASYLVHPHTASSTRWKAWVSNTLVLPQSVRRWLTELGDLFLFAKTMALGPYAAHAPLLERGIDALTLHVRLTSSPQANYLIIDLIRYLEGIVRALSNLHERLHHSMTQYLMPSPLKFVSHSEYLIPNLLLVVPLLVRAVGLILVQDLPGGFDLQALPVGAATVVASFSIYQCSPHVETTHLTALLAILYILAPVILHRNVTIKPSTHQSVLFVTCLLAIYTILPLILSNVAVAFGLSLVWSPLISMQAELQRLPSWIMLTLLVTTWPPTLLLSWFNGYTPFVILAFLPLHLLMYLLFHCTYSSNSNQQEKQ